MSPQQIVVICDEPHHRDQVEETLDALGDPAERLEVATPGGINDPLEVLSQCTEIRGRTGVDFVVIVLTSNCATYGNQPFLVARQNQDAGDLDRLLAEHDFKVTVLEP